MQKTFPRIRVIRNSAAVAVALLAASMLTQLPVAKGATEVRNDANEAVRLIDGARVAAGKPALRVDLFLASKASNGSIPCPDTSGTIGGRAADFAAYNQSNHLLRNCGVPAGTYQLSATKFVDELRARMGYGNAAVGEIIGVNGGYGSGKYLFGYKAWSTWTYSTTGNIVKAWLGSGTHASIILGTWDRMACGAWSPGGSTIFYDCLFARNGPAPAGVASPPTRSPFGDPVPAPAATPVRTTSPVSAPTALSVAPSRTASPSPARTPTASPTSTPSPTAAPSFFAGQAVAGALQSSTGPSFAPASNSMPAAPTTSGRDGTMTAASGGAILAAIGGLLFLFKRRRKASDRAG